MMNKPSGATVLIVGAFAVMCGYTWMNNTGNGGDVMDRARGMWGGGSRDSSRDDEDRAPSRGYEPQEFSDRETYYRSKRLARERQRDAEHRADRERYEAGRR